MPRNKDLNADNSDDDIDIVQSSQKINLSHAEKKQLFSLVKIDHCLWDKRSQLYKKGTAKRKLAWDEFDKMFGLEDGRAKKIFELARMNRRKTLQAIKLTPSSSGKVKVGEIEFDSELSFLDQIEKENTISSSDAIEDIVSDEEVKPRLSKQLSEGSRSLLRKMKQEVPEEGVTVSRKKRKITSSEGILEAIEKNDKLLAS
ncbi:hypothetical protein PMAYCL1PPCAC_09133, partial [Pristionchus mayeri]